VDGLLRIRCVAYDERSKLSTEWDEVRHDGKVLGHGAEGGRRSHRDRPTRLAEGGCSAEVESRTSRREEGEAVVVVDWWLEREV